MNLLLDTSALLWAVLDPDRLSQTAAEALVASPEPVRVSAVSCAELACLQRRGRITLDRHWKPWFDHFVAINGWQVVPADLSIIQEAWSLPDCDIRDPADRIVVATARVRRLVLVTGDRRLIDYPHVKTLW
jgi:PIN domain nuclease of toxin-antitoxin system